MSVSQILSGTPAGIAVTGGVDVPASQASFLGPTSFQDQAITGVLSVTGGDAGGMVIESTVGPLNLVGPAGVSIALTHNVNGGVRVQPNLSPPPAGGGAGLSLFSRSANSTSWEHYATGTTGGGLTADQYSLWAYPSATSAFGKPYWVGYSPLACGSQGVLAVNPDWLDVTRTGQIVGTGAAQVVPVNTIRATSTVHLIPVAGAAFPAAVPAAPVITAAPLPGPPFAAGSFSVTLPAGTTYRYYVYG